MSNTISGSYGTLNPYSGMISSKREANEEEESYKEMIQEHIEEIYTKIQNGDTETKFQIGNESLTENEWNQMLERFDSQEDAIREAVEEQIEKRKLEEQKASIEDIDNTKDLSDTAATAETSAERIDVDNQFYTIKKGADNTLEIYDKATGVSYTFEERYLSIQTDAKTGGQFLISDIPNTTMNVSAMKLTPQLKTALEEYRNGDAVTEKSLDSKFTLTTDATTGIQALHWKSGDGEASVMLMSTAEQKKKFDQLANIYLTQYPNLVSGQQGAELRAAQEVSGNARRTPGGILTITGNAVVYDDNNDYGKNPPDFSHCWSYFFDMDMPDSDYMDFIDDLRETMLSSDAETLASQKDFMEALASRRQERSEENERIQSELLTSESLLAESTTESGTKELHITWMTEDGIFCRKQGQTTGYEWTIPFDSKDEYQLALELFNSIDDEHMPEDISTRKFWEKAIAAAGNM
jgi:hypothetical protein